jgi:DNA repair protein RecO (recombination protein O)
MPRPERSFRTEALILKRRGFGEADRLLTMLTPAHGKIEALAKGARKLTSTKTGHVELFTKADMLIHRGRDLDIVTQAEMVQPYMRLREDLQRGAYASYVAELTDRFTAADAQEEDVALFDLIENTFQRLCDDDDPRLALRYFEVHLLGLTGFKPELNNCVISREPVQPQDQFFSFEEGGILSPPFAHLGGALTPVTLNGLKLLRHIQRSPFSHVQSLTLSNTLQNEVEKILLGYITYVLERRLESIEFIRRLRNYTPKSVSVRASAGTPGELTSVEAIANAIAADVVVDTTGTASEIESLSEMDEDEDEDVNPYDGDTSLAE